MKNEFIQIRQSKLDRLTELATKYFKNPNDYALFIDGKFITYKSNEAVDIINDELKDIKSKSLPNLIKWWYNNRK